MQYLKVFCFVLFFEMGSRDQGIREMGKRGKSCQTGGEMVNCYKGRCERGETLNL